MATTPELPTLATQTSQTLRVFANETSRVLYAYSTPKIIEKKIILLLDYVV